MIRSSFVRSAGAVIASVPLFLSRHDAEGEYYHLVTVWHSTQQEQRTYAENV
jgi:hypothetical protein